MAIGIKQTEGAGYGLLPFFDVSPVLVATAKASGVLVEQLSPGSFSIKGPNGQFFGSVVVKGSAISLAKTNSLGPASKASLKFQFEQAINKALQAIGTNPPTPVLSADEPSLVSVAPSALKYVPPVIPNLSEGKAPIPLHEATELYQPIIGTSAQSVYHVLAIFDGLNLAARIKPSKISFRVEGKKLKTYTSALNDLGFSIKDQYASAHFDVGDQALALKTVGAVIGRLGFNNLKSAGDPITVMGKGV